MEAFRLHPPISSADVLGSFLSSSTIFPASIRDSPATTCALGMPLFRAWVQSLLQNTEQRPETLCQVSG